MSPRDRHALRAHDDSFYKELASKASISPAVLMKEFNRTGKTLVEGNRAEYRFNPTGIVTKQIIARATALKEQPTKL